MTKMRVFVAGAIAAFVTVKLDRAVDKLQGSPTSFFSFFNFLPLLKTLD